MISDKLKNLPLKSGVYLMKDKDGSVIYVGKAKILKNRVSSYFFNLSNHSVKTLALVSNIADFEVIVTDTEVEALVLECNLIKKYSPYYNILLKDDKHFPFIKITLNEDFPRIYPTRNLKKDGAKYFGPFISAFAVNETIDILRKIFKVRTCNKELFSKNQLHSESDNENISKRQYNRPCLYYHIKQCNAPCAGKISKADYFTSIEQAMLILQGKHKSVSNELTEQMKAASDNLEFEKAARLRDKIVSIAKLGERQKVMLTNDNNRDCFGFYRKTTDSQECCVQVFYMREGRVVGSEHFVFDALEKARDDEILSEFLPQFYMNITNIPKEILLPFSVADIDILADFLSQKAGGKVNVTVPKKGDKANIVKMVNDNAKISYDNQKLKTDKADPHHNDVLRQFMDALNMLNPPHRIECYDISNIAGSNSVGAYVVYKNAKPYRKDYRKFNIKNVEGSDDYESIREVLRRRIKRAEHDLKNFGELPDLIVIDGGVGHVSAANEVVSGIPICGIVKDDKHKTRGLCNQNGEIPLDKDGELFKFLAKMQDEVHRFAITAYRKGHEKDMLSKSILTEIRGIGEERRKKLLLHFGSIEGIKKATLQELTEVIDKSSAKNVHDYFNQNKG